MAAVKKDYQVFLDYYRARMPLLKRALPFFKREIKRSWAGMAVGPGGARSLSPDFTGGAIEMLSQPVISYLERRGKMLRSLLPCILLESKGKKPRDYLPLVAMMEIMESDTIMIDDIIDDSPRRRGGPSAHKIFGVAKTILSGGFFYYSSWGIFSGKYMPVSEKCRNMALNWFAKRHLLTTIGQSEEIFYREKRIPLDLKRYCQEISSRISVLSFGGPLVLGGIAAGFSGREISILDELGDYSGLAYHLRGDELNLFPESGEWGKETADDIKAGTMTYILFCAFGELDGRDRDFLARNIGKRSIHRKDLRRCLSLIRESGAIEKNRKAIDLLAGKCFSLINKLDMKEKYRSLLKSAVVYMAYERNK